MRPRLDGGRAFWDVFWQWKEQPGLGEREMLFNGKTTPRRPEVRYLNSSNIFSVASLICPTALGPCLPVSPIGPGAILGTCYLYRTPL